MKLMEDIIAFVALNMRAHTSKIHKDTVSILMKQLTTPRIVQIYITAIETKISPTKLYKERSSYGLKIRKQAHFKLYRWVKEYPREAEEQLRIVEQKTKLYAFVHGLQGKHGFNYKSISVRDIVMDSKDYDGAINEINEFIVNLDWVSWFDLSLSENLTYESGEFDIRNFSTRQFELEIVTVSNTYMDERQYYLYYEQGRLHIEHMFADFPTHNLIKKLKEVGVWE